VTQCGNSIVLIGMMGAGKSSVGHCLRRCTGLDLFDVDDIVASKFRMSIPEVFSKYGQQGFREAEAEALLGLPSTQQAIIVTGGGIVLREQNVNVLKQLGIVVWLDGNEETLFARAWQEQNRPLLQTNDPRDAFSQILRARKPLYAKIADIRVDTSMLTDEEVAVAILSKLRRVRRDWRLGSPSPATP
jgi:shikimate kinase